MPPKQKRGKGRGRGNIRDDAQQHERREYEGQGQRGRRGQPRGRHHVPPEQPAAVSQQSALAQPLYDMPENIIQGQGNIRGDAQQPERREYEGQGQRGRRGQPWGRHHFPPEQPAAVSQQSALAQSLYGMPENIVQGQGRIDYIQQPQYRGEGPGGRREHMRDQRYMTAQQFPQVIEQAASVPSTRMELPLHDMPEHGIVSKKKTVQESGQRAKQDMSKRLEPVRTEGAAALEKVGIRFQTMDITSSTFPPRRGIGTKGHKIGLIANYFEIEIPHGEVYHYDVEVLNIRKVETPEEPSVAGESAKSNIKKYKCLNTRHNRNVIEAMLKQVGLFKQVRPAYDGEKNLFTRNPLPIVEPKTFSVKMEEENHRISMYEVSIQPVNKEGQTTPMISLEPLHQLFAGKCRKITEEIRMGVMALETILRHGPALKLVPVGRSFFHKPREHEIPPLSGGREIWMGYHQSVKIAHWKPMVNIDMSATTFYKSGPVISYMMDIFHPSLSDEDKRRELHKIRYLNDRDRRALAKELKTLKIEVTHLSYPRKYRVYDISKDGADNTFFSRETVGKTQKISVSNYFKLEYRALQFPNLPCLNVGSAKKSIFLPLEVCNIIEGQHCKKKLSEVQTSEMIKYTARPPAERFQNIQKALQKTNEEFRPFSTEFGIRINTNPTKLEGRVLEPPHVLYDQQKEIMPFNGAWDMKGKRFFSGETIDKWILISFSTARWCDKNALDNFADMLCRGGQQVGMKFNYPELIQSYGPRYVPGDIIKNEKRRMPDLQLAVVVLPTKGPQTIYAEIKSVAETEIGLTTQCVKDANITGRKCNPQLICNLCQKINAKMGGVNNSLVPAEKPQILRRPVIIIGADCTHPAPGDKVKPSIAAVVGSLDGYPSRYKASVRVQEPKELQDDKATRQEIIVDLKEMIKDLLKAFYQNTNGKKPEKIIFYRDGVSEGEFSKVVEKEVQQVRKACEELSRGEEYKPPLTFIVVGKRHHTRFAPQNPRRDGVGKCQNVPPGTTVDTVVTHPIDSDFFMCSHTGIQGTSRPAHYTVLWDDNNMDADELQTLTYFLCHTYVRCTRSISVPCPVMYAHLAAFRAKQYLIYQTEETSSSSDSSIPMAKEVLKQSVREAVKVVEEMQNTMYFA